MYDVIGHFMLQGLATSALIFSTTILTVQTVFMFTLELEPVVTIIRVFVAKMGIVGIMFLIQAMKSNHGTS